MKRVNKSDAEWQAILSPDQYRVTRQKGTEPAFTGKYYAHKEKGLYRCVGCGAPLFDSRTKYDSGSGWPSFWAPMVEDNVRYEKDDSWFARRTEVLCAVCDAHLGHVFDDGPAPTHQRYCINSAALDFVKAEDG